MSTAAGVSRKIRRKLYTFLFAVIYAFVFFEVGMKYQENNSKTKHKGQQNIVNIQESKILRRKELLSDWHHQPHILLKSALKGNVTAKTMIQNDTTSFTIGKTTSSSRETFHRVKYSSTVNSDILVI